MTQSLEVQRNGRWTLSVPVSEAQWAFLRRCEGHCGLCLPPWSVGMKSYHETGIRGYLLDMGGLVFKNREQRADSRERSALSGGAGPGRCGVGAQRNGLSGCLLLHL